MAGGRPKGVWTPEIVRQRIKTSQLLARLQKHALDGEKNENMSITQLKAATFLLSRVVGQPKDPIDLNINGNMTCVFRDPTDRPPEMNGYHRKPQLTDRD